MRSKTLISYQKGYCGQPADIEAMKPREARAYCLGVGHVAAGALPFGSGAEVLAALSTMRRGVGVDGEVAAATPKQTANGLTVGNVVKLVSLSGPKTLAYLRQSSSELAFSKEFIITQVIGNTIHIRQKPSETLAIYGEFPPFGPLDAADFALVSSDKAGVGVYDYVGLVRSADLGGEETRAHAWHLAASGQNCFRVLTRTPDYLRIALRDGSSVLVNAADFAPVAKDAPR